MKAKARISLTSPPIAENAIQSGVLKIKAKDYWVYGNTWWPEDHPKFQTFRSKVNWFLGGFSFAGGYGNLSGTVGLYPFNINILVKVKPYHAIKFETISLIQLQPNQITSIPIKIENIHEIKPYIFALGIVILYKILFIVNHFMIKQAINMEVLIINQCTLILIKLLSTYFNQPITYIKNCTLHHYQSLLLKKYFIQYMA